MDDRKLIRERLWNSLDMHWIKTNTVMIAVVYGIIALIYSLRIPEPGLRWQLVGIMFLLVVMPWLVFYLWRTIRIFRKAEEYTFCKCCLSQPKGGNLKHSIRFTVILTDSEGRKFAADTHSIFSTRSTFGLGLEDYVNKTVTVAYNEETGMVVVIG